MASAQEALAELVGADRGRLLAALTGQLGDLQLAEDCLQDAVESALEHWARNGVPAKPQGWLLRVAQRKAIDRIRRDARFRDKVTELAELSSEEAPEPDAIPDERLAMIFTCCHPALDAKSRVALTLRTIGGLTTQDIARAFLDKDATMGQRLSRAKNKMRHAGISFQVPGAELWPERLHSVLTVIYLIYNQGYTAGAEDVPARAGLCEEALFLARLVNELQPGDPEIEGLVALMLLSHARHAARMNGAGTLVPLSQQNADLWDQALIDEGQAWLDRAIARGASGRFQLQAAINALHVEGGRSGATDWRQIVLLYDALLRLEPSPVVALNRLAALAEIAGADAVLDAVTKLGETLSSYQPFQATLASLQARTGNTSAARAAYEQAIHLSEDAAQIAYLRGQLEALS